MECDLAASESFPLPDALPDRQSAYRWFVLALATVAQVGGCFLVQGLGGLGPFLQAAFRLDAAEVGLAMSAAQMTPIVGFVVAGLLLDRFSERLIVGAGAVMVAAALLAAARAEHYGDVLFWLFVASIGYCTIQPGGGKVVAAWFPAHARGLAMGIRQAGLPLGAALGALILPIAAARHGWRAAFDLGAVAALATADLAVGNGPNESTALPPGQFDVLRADSKDPVIAFLKERLKETAAPDRRDRVELAAIDFHWPNATLVHGLDHDLGYNPIRLKILEDATGAGDHLALPEQREFSKLYPAYRSPMSDFLGLRYVASGVPIEAIDKNYKPGDLEELTQIGKVHIYENKSAFPRVFVATCALHVDFAQMLKSGEWPEADYRETVLLEEPPICHTRKGLPPDAARARILSYGNTEIVVEANAPQGGGWLVLNEVWHPWWFAALDGEAAEILRANVMFRAVAIPEGRHEVRFVFQPLRGLSREMRERR